MKIKLIACLSAFAAFTLLVASCKKAAEALKTPIEQAQVAAHSDDEAMVSDGLDALTSDMNTLIGAEASISGDASVVDAPICDATIAFDANSDPMTLTITFNGGNCGLKYTRTGVVVLSMEKGTEWKNAGAFFNVQYEDFKITRKSDQKSITFNGTLIYSNMSGGLLSHLASSGGSVLHGITGENLSLKFDDGETRQWNIARLQTYSYDAGLVIAISGGGTVGDATKVAEWGTNRFGNDFVTTIPADVVMKQDCDFKIGAGTVQHKTDAYTASVTFGLNASGEPTGCPGTGHYYYKIDWSRTNDTNHFDVILPY